MSTTTTKGSGSTNNNTGRVMTGGTVGTDNFNKTSIKNLGREFKETTPNVGFGTGVKYASQGADVATASVADNGSGFCRFSKSSHGLSVGDVLHFKSATASSLNVTHVVTAVPTSGTFDTNIFYAASATSGTYNKQTGTLNNMVEGQYLGTHISPDTLAGLSNTALRHNGGVEGHTGINRLVSARQLDEESWSYTTHAVTKGSNAGDSYDFQKPKGSGTLDEESVSVYNNAGSITYMKGDTEPVTKDYTAYTG